MKYLKYFAICLFFVACISSRKNQHELLHAYHFSGLAQGTTYHITYYATDSFFTKNNFDSIFVSIDSSLSIYKPYSLINRFNNDTSEVLMDKHMKLVVEKSIDVFKESQGLFDITVYPLVTAWGFGSKKTGILPDSATIGSLLHCIGSDKIFIDRNRLKKSNPCTKIDVNGIAQGYSVDVIADFLELNKIQNYLVEIGGEIRVKGNKYPSGELFRIGIESPGENEFEDAVIKQTVQLKKGAITTSGNYRRYYESDGKIISHLIDPKTGYPLQNELISVTVVAKDAITADGYDNVLMGMGLKDAFTFLEKHKDMEAHFIYHDIAGHVADTATVGFYKLMQK